MKKKVISFTDPQAEYIDAEAERLGISPAEFLRRIVDWYRGERPLEKSETSIGEGGLRT